MSDGGSFQIARHPAFDDNTDLVVIDDIGAERPTEWAVDTLTYLVEEIHLAGEEKLLITTTNYSPAELGGSPTRRRRPGGE
jgi:DNA replication protein DnaC